MSAIHPTRPTVANIYNPQNQTKEQLIEGFVVRQQLFKKLFKAIKEAKMETPEQHYLILGRRGMGKTTLLLRLAYEIENDPDLNNWLIPLVFNEEEYGIRGLYKFWERVMELLEEKHPAFRFEAAEIRRLSKENPDHDAYEKALFEWLSSELTRNGKKLVLFVDNFGDMARKLGDAEAHRLRKILQTSADIRIFAASSVVLEAFYKYDHPFYEFFKQVELGGLNEKETRELLLALSRHYKKDEVQRIVEQNPGRIEALRRITGGVIRSVVLLFEIFADDHDGSAFHDLQIILDRTSPLYKHRMDDLSDQQQAIVEAIALNWDAISVKEIAEQTRLESKVVSAQLSNLEKNGIVEKRATRTKNHLYLIAERFFNIWFLMRLGRKADQKRVLWLVRFFEEWCDEELIKDRAERHIEALKKGKFDPEGAFYITQAMAAVKDLDPISQHKMLEETKTYLSKIDIELAQSLKPSDLDMAMQVITKWYSGKREEAIQLLYSVKSFANSGLNNLVKGFDGLPSFLNLSKNDLRCWQKALDDFTFGISTYYLIDLQNIAVAQKCLEYAAKSGHIISMINLGWLYENEQNNLVKAKGWYLKAIEKGSSSAMINLGWLYNNKFEDYKKAEEWYLKAIEKGNSSAMITLGWLYNNKFEDYKKAEEWYQKAAEFGESKAMLALGWLYNNKFEDYKKAEEWYQKAAEFGESKAMLALGWLYNNKFEDYKKAEEWYQKASENGEFKAMLALGRLYNNKFEDYKKAEESYLAAAEKGDSQAMFTVGWLCKNVHKNLEKAQSWYEQAAINGNISAINGLAWLLFGQKKKKVKALDLAAEAFQKDPIKPYYARTYACILVWYGNIDKALDIATNFLWNRDYQEKEKEDLILFFTLLLAKNQTQALYDIFTSPQGEEHNFKDRFKPMWYAILKKLDHPDFLRMGDELAQTVEEILAKAEQMAEDYK